MGRFRQWVEIWVFAIEQRAIADNIKLPCIPGNASQATKLATKKHNKNIIFF